LPHAYVVFSPPVARFYCTSVVPGAPLPSACPAERVALSVLEEILTCRIFLMSVSIGESSCFAHGFPLNPKMWSMVVSPTPRDGVLTLLRRDFVFFFWYANGSIFPCQCLYLFPAGAVLRGTNLLIFPSWLPESTPPLESMLAFPSRCHCFFEASCHDLFLISPPPPLPISGDSVSFFRTHFKASSLFPVFIQLILRVSEVPPPDDLVHFPPLPPSILSSRESPFTHVSLSPEHRTRTLSTCLPPPLFIF